MKKFELTSETKVVLGRTLHRIRALISFGDVEAGSLGGWIEKEENLDHSGKAWVYGNAQVFGNACVYGDAQVYGDARVYGNAWVYCKAWVSDDAQVYGDARVFGKALVSGNAQVYGNAQVSDDAWLFGNAQVYGKAWVYCKAWVSDDARVFGKARVFGIGAIFWISAIGSRNGTVTFFACQDGKIRAAAGCFFGDLDDFEKKIQATHGENVHAKVYRLAIEMAKERIRTPEDAEAEK